MYYPFVRKALFQLDPERAHEFTFQQLRRITGTPLEALVRQKVPAKPVTCMGLTFKNPLGLPPDWIKTSALMRSARWDLVPLRLVP
jgi:dihydroorotate dehydrogenase